MDLKQLETFVHVAELGSFTRAANALKVAQPALSRQVRLLEVELHQTLFDRTGRGVVVTEAGKRLLAHGRVILAQVERALQDLEDQRGAATGRLVIGLPPSVSRQLTGSLVAAFRERFPKATLSVVEGLSTTCSNGSRSGASIAPSPTTSPRPAASTCTRGSTKALYLVSTRAAATGHGDVGPLIGPPATLAEVAERQLVIPSRPHSMRMPLEAALSNEGRRARVGFEIESIPAILDLVRGHAMHAVLPLNALPAADARHFEVRTIGTPPLAATLWIASSAQRPPGPLLEPSLELVAQLMRAIWSMPDRDNS
ncbi:MAG: LysR family transcriptional regulator [Burkholderiaceae bacterium]